MYDLEDNGGGGIYEDEVGRHFISFVKRQRVGRLGERGEMASSVLYVPLGAAVGALVFPVCLTGLSCPVLDKMGSVLDHLDFKLARSSKSMELAMCARFASWATESNLNISTSPKEGPTNGKEWLGRRVTMT